MRYANRAGALFLALIFSVGTAAAQEPASKEDAEKRQGVTLTIYNGDTALVADRRKLRLEKGVNRIAVEGVSARMQPETALVAVEAPGDPTVVEQSFRFDLLTPQALLEHAVGKTVRVVRTHPTTGEETVVEAELLSAANGVVLRIGDRIETTVPGRIVFDSVPAGLAARPVLSATVVSETAGEAVLDLGYLTGGLDWRADYVGRLDGDALALRGLATVTNTSGADYNGATVRLVAGAPNRIAPPRPMMLRGAAASVAKEAYDAAPSQPVGDYHLFRLPHPVTLADGESKQVALFDTTRVPVEKTYRLIGGMRFLAVRQDRPITTNPEVLLSFRNDSASGLGGPLPSGTVRVYGPAGDAPAFLGEDRLEDTAAGEDVSLAIGRSFDVTATRRQTDFRHAGLPKGSYESAQTIELRNARQQPVTVKVVEPIPGDWQILAESAPHEKESADRAVWTVAVPADGKAMLSYRVRVQLP